jgi:hypothetical protein
LIDNAIEATKCGRAYRADSWWQRTTVSITAVRTGRRRFVVCLFSASTRRKRRASSAYRCANPLRPFPLRPFPLGQRRGAHHPHIGVRSCDRTCGRKPTDLSNRPIAVATNSSDRRGDRMLVVLLLHKTRFAGICVSARVQGRVCQRASVQLRAQPRVHGRCIGPKGSRSGTTDQE